MEYQLVQMEHKIREQTHRSPTKRRTSRMKWFGLNRWIPDWLPIFVSTIQFKLVKTDTALVISKLENDKKNISIPLSFPVNLQLPKLKLPLQRSYLLLHSHFRSSHHLQLMFHSFHGLSTLGARDFSSAVSGFCQVFIVTLYSDFAARGLGLQCRAEDNYVSLHSANTKNSRRAQEKPLVPRVRIKMNSTNWPAPNNAWVFIAQLVGHCSANAKTMGSNTVEFPRRSYLHWNFQPPWSTTKNRTKNQSISSFHVLLPVQRQIFPPKLSSICCLVGLGFSFNKLKQKWNTNYKSMTLFPRLWGKTVINLWQKNTFEILL